MQDEIRDQRVIQALKDFVNINVDDETFEVLVDAVKAIRNDAESLRALNNVNDVIFIEHKNNSWVKEERVIVTRNSDSAVSFTVHYPRP